MVSKRQQGIFRIAEGHMMKTKIEDRRGKTGLGKPNANAPGPGKHPKDTKGEVIADKHQRGKGENKARAINNG